MAWRSCLLLIGVKLHTRSGYCMEESAGDLVEDVGRMSHKVFCSFLH